MHLLEKMAKKGEELGVNSDFNTMVNTGYFFREDWQILVRSFPDHYFVKTKGSVPVSIQKEFEKIMRTHNIENNSISIYLWSDETGKIQRAISDDKETEIHAMKMFTMLNLYFTFDYENSNVLVASKTFTFEHFILEVCNFNGISIGFNHPRIENEPVVSFNSEDIDTDSSFFLDIQENIEKQEQKIKEMLSSFPYVSFKLRYCFSGHKFSYVISDPSVGLFHRVMNSELEEIIEDTKNFLHKYQILYRFYEVCAEEDPYFCIIDDPAPSMAEHHIFLFQTYFSFNLYDFLEKGLFDSEDAKEILRKKVKGIKLKSVLQERKLPERLFPFLYSVCGMTMKNIKQIRCEEKIEEEIFQKTVVLPKKEQPFLQVEKDKYKDLYEHYTFSVEGDTLWIKKKE